jgi:hypothetical protein
MDHTGSDKFALEAFSLAFAIQRIFQSRLIPPEAKERLFRDYRKLKESVALLTKIKENKEASEKMSQRG